MGEFIELEIDRGDGFKGTILTSDDNVYAKALLSMRRYDSVTSSASGYSYRLPVHEHEFVCVKCMEPRS